MASGLVALFITLVLGPPVGALAGAARPRGQGANSPRLHHYIPPRGLMEFNGQGA